MLGMRSTHESGSRERRRADDNFRENITNRMLTVESKIQRNHESIMQKIKVGGSRNVMESEETRLDEACRNQTK